MYKAEIQEDDGLWKDLRGADGNPLTFATKDEARAKIAEMHPVLAKMENYITHKRTRVIAVLDDDED